ncbi:MAG: acetyl-CoA/propionyl-CoA carboxylase, biotin carboxylase, biotin carboxyl carrier protein [Candidatus Binatota bacterium]|nr:acetyl-CoA/propionyl-CoA carboxylase, biotin carboxylase, biotin carboxyl carrier protein [Candidatus Binatota bacterium]
MKLLVVEANEPIEVDASPAADGREVRIGETSWRVSSLAAATPAGAALVDDHPVRYLALREGKVVRISVQGECYDFDFSGKAAVRRGGTSLASPETRAPMPGKVLKVEVSVGSRVEPGTALLILEAMKMETTLYAEVAGIVSHVDARPDEMVDPGKVLVRVAVDP